MAGYTLVTAPSITPIDLEDVQRWAKVFDEYEDNAIRLLIDSAVEYTQKLLDRQLISQTWKLELDGFPCDYNFNHPLWPLGSTAEIEIAKKPVSSITSITYIDSDGDTNTLSSSLYQLDTSSTPARVKPTAGNSWPSTKSDTYSTVTVTFVTGYGSTKASVPANIREALLIYVAHAFESRDGMGMPPQSYFDRLNFDTVEAFG